MNVLCANDPTDDTDEKSPVDNGPIAFKVDWVRISAHFAEVFDVVLGDQPDQLELPFAGKPPEQLLRNGWRKLQHRGLQHNPAKDHLSFNE